MSHVESGFHPHAINISGQSFFPSSHDEALRLLLRSRNNVDIGLMQVNWGYWGEKFGLSKPELLDPQLNVLVGARILEHCVRVERKLVEGDSSLPFSSRRAATSSTSRRFGNLISVC